MRSSISKLFLCISTGLMLSATSYANNPAVPALAEHENEFFYDYAAQPSFSRIFIFGDSLSDTGNTYRLFRKFMPKSPPYFKGRFSNGPVWAENFSAQLNMPENLVFNYAYGGAEAINHSIFIPSLERQITKFLQANHNNLDPNALYVMWIGANDILFDDKSGYNSKLLFKMHDVVYTQLFNLIKYGAKRILVPLLPNLALTPDALDDDANSGNNKRTQKLASMSADYNRILLKSLQDLANEHPDVKIMSFDTYTALEDAEYYGRKYGIKILNTRCSFNSYTSSGKPICPNPAEYLFWDGVHPTKRGHDALADFMFQVIANAGYSKYMYQPDVVGMNQVISNHNQQAIAELLAEGPSRQEAEAISAQPRNTLKFRGLQTL